MPIYAGLNPVEYRGQVMLLSLKNYKEFPVQYVSFERADFIIILVAPNQFT